MNYYKYLIITAEDVDEWCSDKISTNESFEAGRQRRQRYRKKIMFLGISCSFYMWYMGTKIVSYVILWKVPCSELERCGENIIACISQSRNELPNFLN